jgi:hypothetical protein
MEAIRQTLQAVFDEVFSKDEDRSISVFLCGKSLEDPTSLRSKIHARIINNPRLNVVFPEWLFQNLLGQKDFNLLSLEKLLADSVDLIVLPLEGMGTLVELGAFASNEALIDRILIRAPLETHEEFTQQ